MELLDVLQPPNAITIYRRGGRGIYAGSLEADVPNKNRDTTIQTSKTDLVLPCRSADIAIDRWDNECGEYAHDSPYSHYGRRVEADRSWTVYHVYTGVPARIDGNTMIGLTQQVATDGMLSLNIQTEARRRVGGTPILGIRTAPSATKELRR